MSYHVRYDSSNNVILDGIIHEAYNPKAVVLMLHGINSDKDEEGLFVKLSKVLVENSYNVFRFDFRAHGMSTGKQKYVTILGETEDLIFSLDWITEKWKLPVFIVAASFGAVSLLNSWKRCSWENIKGIILLNPVLDLQETFLHSNFSWPKKSFNEESYKKLRNQGFFLLDNKLKVGHELMEEITTLKPYKNLSMLDIPILILHGDKDKYVSYDISKKYSDGINKCEFYTLNGADHGFEKKDEQKKVLQIITKWLGLMTNNM